jgi:SAM-dependent methyltransferase
VSVSLRRQIISEVIDPASARIVEIGALDNPTFSPSDYNIRFIDYATKEQLRDQYKENPRYALDRVVEVQYPISSLDYAAQIHERFDLAIANHVIEHIPDTIRWMNSLSEILNDEGYLFLAVPDRRYTFDYLRPETTIADVLRAYQDKMNKPNVAQIFEHMYHWRPIKAGDAWAGRIPDLLKQPRQNIRQAMATAERQSRLSHVSVHCNVYTYQSFLTLFSELIELGMLQVEIAHSQDVLQGENEFHVMLRRRKGGTPRSP